MNRQFLPYYLSRFAISCGFALIVIGLSWKAVLLASVLFGLFLLYLHSGWFSIDLTNPFFPLRRDDRGILIQRKAILVAVMLGFLIHLLASKGFVAINLLPGSGNIALTFGILAYFIAQVFLFVRT